MSTDGVRDLILDRIQDMDVKESLTLFFHITDKALEFSSVLGSISGLASGIEKSLTLLGILDDPADPVMEKMEKLASDLQKLYTAIFNASQLSLLIELGGLHEDLRNASQTIKRVSKKKVLDASDYKDLQEANSKSDDALSKLLNDNYWLVLYDPAVTPDYVNDGRGYWLEPSFDENGGMTVSSPHATTAGSLRFDYRLVLPEIVHAVGIRLAAISAYAPFYRSTGEFQEELDDIRNRLQRFSFTLRNAIQTTRGLQLEDDEHCVKQCVFMTGYTCEFFLDCEEPGLVTGWPVGAMDTCSGISFIDPRNKKIPLPDGSPCLKNPPFTLTVEGTDSNGYGTCDDIKVTYPPEYCYQEIRRVSAKISRELKVQLVDALGGRSIDALLTSIDVFARPPGESETLDMRSSGVECTDIGEPKPVTQEGGGVFCEAKSFDGTLWLRECEELWRSSYCPNLVYRLYLESQSTGGRVELPFTSGSGEAKLNFEGTALSISATDRTLNYTPITSEIIFVYECSLDEEKREFELRLKTGPALRKCYGLRLVVEETIHNGSVLRSEYYLDDELLAGYRIEHGHHFLIYSAACENARQAILTEWGKEQTTPTKSTVVDLGKPREQYFDFRHILEEFWKQDPTRLQRLVEIHPIMKTFLKQIERGDLSGLIHKRSIRDFRRQLYSFSRHRGGGESHV